ncbi:MAG: DinB family protein [Maribacter sp.]
MKTSDLKENELNFFYGTYLRALDENVELLAALLEGKEWMEGFIRNLKDNQLGYRYKEDKWTIAEVLVHLIDTERIFQYRAFRISRNDMTPLPGFEQDDYIKESNSNQRTKEDILYEYLTVRDASISLFKGLTDEKLKRIGTASGMPWSVAALGLAISGHQRHHETILKERYL